MNPNKILGGWKSDKYADGMSISEISARLGIAECTVKSNLKRGIRKLKKYMLNNPVVAIRLKHLLTRPEFHGKITSSVGKPIVSED